MEEKAFSMNGEQQQQHIIPMPCHLNILKVINPSLVLVWETTYLIMYSRTNKTKFFFQKALSSKRNMTWNTKTWQQKKSRNVIPFRSFWRFTVNQIIFSVGGQII